MAAANHVEHGLVLFLFDDFERALERRQLWLRQLDDFVPFGMPSIFFGALMDFGCCAFVCGPE